MKILIAPDKFKGSLSAKEVCMAIARGIRKIKPEANIAFHPMADGGDGSLQAISDHLKVHPQKVITQDPLGRELEAGYLISGDKAFVEMASVSGLVLLEEKERNPLYTSTFGTGLLIKDAILKGCKEIFLFLGGSATNDAGIGIAAALGCQFFDRQKELLPPVGKSLADIHSIEVRPFFKPDSIQFTLLCDVANLLYGPNGAAHVYAKQKGASDHEIEELDLGLRHFAALINQQFQLDISQIEGVGAAGGIGASMLSFFNADLKSGFSVLSELTGLSQKILKADQVITGEGKLDAQSLEGKVVQGVASLCKRHQKRLTAFVGGYALKQHQIEQLNIQKVYAISDMAGNLQDAMIHGVVYLEKLGEQYAEEML